MTKFKINIARPYPGTGENEKIISYIEPLRKDNLVSVSEAYWFNLKQHINGEEPSLSPGFKYTFWFAEESTAKEFVELFHGEIL